MSLTDIMSNMNLTFWPQAALVLFLGVFVVVGAATFARDRRDEQEEARHLPLEEDGPSSELRGEA